jgi:hypothetical protein
MEIRLSGSLHTLRQIPTRLEISFWSTVTYWMSESHLFQQALREAYAFKTLIAENRRKVIRLSMIWASAGWLAGFLLGLLNL